MEDQVSKVKLFLEKFEGEKKKNVDEKVKKQDEELKEMIDTTLSMEQAFDKARAQVECLYLEFYLDDIGFFNMVVWKSGGRGN